MAKGYFEFDEISSEIFDIVCKSIKRPLMPAMKTKTVNINGQSGVYDFGENEYEPFILTMSIAYVGDSLIDIRSKARDIASWLKTNKWSKLIIGDEPDKYYLARVANEADLETLKTLGQANIPFICQPFAYMTVDTGEDLTWNQADFPWITDVYWNMSEAYTFKTTSNKNFTFNNPGTRKTNYRSPQGSKSLIKINGSWTTLNISMNGNTLTYTQSSSGELIIDNVGMEAALDGTNALSAIDGNIEEFLEITPGDNIISISGTGINVEVTIDFAPMWI